MWFSKHKYRKQEKTSLQIIHSIRLTGIFGNQWRMFLFAAKWWHALSLVCWSYHTQVNGHMLRAGVSWILKRKIGSRRRSPSVRRREALRCWCRHCGGKWWWCLCRLIPVDHSKTSYRVDRLYVDVCSQRQLQTWENKKTVFLTRTVISSPAGTMCFSL